MTDEIKTVGFAGLGRMGLAKAKHCLNAGYKVVGFDISEGPMSAAADAGVETMDSAAAVAAASDVMIVIVPSDDDVRAACLGDAGAFGGETPGTIVVLCSSLMPETVTEIAAAAPDGVDILDCPSTRGPEAADDGTLALLVGGEAEVLARARPVLETFGEVIHHLGPLGAGQVAKTVNNILLWCNMQTTMEVLSMSKDLGLDAEAMRKAMYDCSGDSWALRRLPLINPAWPVKDMKNAMVIRDQTGTAMPMSALMADLADGLSMDAVAKLLKS
jgi:3-hydroxyisobutyrate dehydrogenase-like beta-hydroxyacid dehydrogenase